MELKFRKEAAAWAFWRLAAAGVIVVLLTAVASAQYCTPDQCDECDLCDQCLNCCNEAPEFWVINSRCAPRCNNLDAGFEKLTYKRWDPECCRWVKECRESFLALAPVPTFILSHGNTLKHKPAMKSAWELHKRLRCCPGPKRLVFWSWPAQIVYKRPLLRPRKLILKNLRIKFVYAEYQGYYMAKLLQQMDMSQRVMVAGHSYGAISAATAAHWLGGGTLRGLTLEGGAPVEIPNFRIAMISGAFDNDAMLPGCRYGQSFVTAEKVYVTRNCRDKTLDNWPRVSFRGRMAIGVTGLNANRLGQYRDKLCQHTLTSDVGRSHYLGPHLESKKFVSTLCCLSFPGCSAYASQPLVPIDAPADATASDAEASPAEMTLIAPTGIDSPNQEEDQPSAAADEVAVKEESAKESLQFESAA